MELLRNIFHKIFGNWSTPSDAYRNLSSQYIPNSTFVSEKNKGTSLIANDGISNVLSSLAARLTGAQLTGAEREANQFSHDEALLAFNRDMEASNTAYQRKVADLQAAGINPMMAASSGVSVPSASTAASVSPSAAAFQFADIMNLIRMRELLPLEKEQMKAQVRMTNEEVKEKQTTNSYLSESERLRIEGIKKANSLSNAQISQIYANISKTQAEFSKIIAETKNEEEKNILILSEIALNNANARRIAELLPFEKTQMSASSQLALANAAWQNGLIDRGMIEVAVEKAGYERDSAEYKSAIDRVESQISGDIPVVNLHPAADMIIKSIGKVSRHMFPKLF